MGTCTTQCDDASTSDFNELAQLFGHHIFELEHAIEELAGALSAEDQNPYTAGTWKSLGMHRGWRLVLEEERNWHVVNPMSGFEGDISSDLFSYAVWVKTLSGFAMSMYQTLGGEDERLKELKNLFCLVQEFARINLDEKDREVFLELLA